MTSVTRVTARGRACGCFDGPVGSGKTRFLASLISDVAQAKKRNDSKVITKFVVASKYKNHNAIHQRSPKFEVNE